MKLGKPYCCGSPQAHPLRWMRLERACEGALPYWRCPECWGTTYFAENEPLDELFVRQQSAILIDDRFANELRAWSEPVQVKVEPTSDDRILEMQMRRVESA